MTFDVQTYRNFKRRRMLDPHQGAAHDWPKTLAHLEQLILADDPSVLFYPRMQKGFYLRNGGQWQRAQLEYLREEWNEEELKELLFEDVAGPLAALISDEHYQTTEARVNHLTHLTILRQHTNVNPIGLNRVVEFGGGYGGMCKLMRAKTHYLIDLPVMLFLQQAYLGADRVKMILDEEDAVQDGKVNLLPVHFMPDFAAALDKPDLLVCCWSLDETSPEMQEHFRSLKFFNAAYILYGSHEKAPRPEYFDGYETVASMAAFYSRPEHYMILRKVA